MANTKTATYTPEQTDTVLAAYAAGQTAEQIAEQVNKTARSVIAKLARHGVYKTEPQPTRRARKSEMVGTIAATLQLDADAISSLEKATHEALHAVAEAIRRSAIADVVEAETDACAAALLGSEI